ncbi:hypothetical protein BDK51DRAFT_35054, partial [Blyttiomyces helicus]
MAVFDAGNISAEDTDYSDGEAEGSGWHNVAQTPYGSALPANSYASRKPVSATRGNKDRPASSESSASSASSSSVSAGARSQIPSAAAKPAPRLRLVTSRSGTTSTHPTPAPTPTVSFAPSRLPRQAPAPAPATVTDPPPSAPARRPSRHVSDSSFSSAFTVPEESFGLSSDLSRLRVATSRSSPDLALDAGPVASHRCEGGASYPATRVKKKRKWTKGEEVNGFEGVGDDFDQEFEMGPAVIDLTASSPGPYPSNPRPAPQTDPRKTSRNSTAAPASSSTASSSFSSSTMRSASSFSSSRTSDDAVVLSGVSFTIPSRSKSIQSRRETGSSIGPALPSSSRADSVGAPVEARRSGRSRPSESNPPHLLGGRSLTMEDLPDVAAVGTRQNRRSSPPRLSHSRSTPRLGQAPTSAASNGNISDAELARMLQEEEYAVFQPANVNERMQSFHHLLNPDAHSDSESHRSRSRSHRRGYARPHAPPSFEMDYELMALLGGDAAIAAMASRPHSRRRGGAGSGGGFGGGVYAGAQGLSGIYSDLFGAGVAANPSNYLGDDEIDMSYESLLALGERIGEVKKKQGVPDAAIHTLLERRYKVGSMSEDEAKCTICLAEYEPNELLKGLQCLHWFHVDTTYLSPPTRAKQKPRNLIPDPPAAVPSIIDYIEDLEAPNRVVPLHEETGSHMKRAASFSLFHATANYASDPIVQPASPSATRNCEMLSQELTSQSHIPPAHPPWQDSLEYDQVFRARPRVIDDRDVPTRASSLRGPNRGGNAYIAAPPGPTPREVELARSRDSERRDRLRLEQEQWAGEESPPRGETVHRPRSRSKEDRGRDEAVEDGAVGDGRGGGARLRARSRSPARHAAPPSTRGSDPLREAWDAGTGYLDKSMTPRSRSPARVPATFSSSEVPVSYQEVDRRTPETPDRGRDRQGGASLRGGPRPAWEADGYCLQENYSHSVASRNDDHVDQRAIPPARSLTASFSSLPRPTSSLSRTNLMEVASHAPIITATDSRLHHRSRSPGAGLGPAPQTGAKSSHQPVVAQTRIPIADGPRRPRPMSANRFLDLGSGGRGGTGVGVPSVTVGDRARERETADEHSRWMADQRVLDQVQRRMVEERRQRRMLEDRESEIKVEFEREEALRRELQQTDERDAQWRERERIQHVQHTRPHHPQNHPQDHPARDPSPTRSRSAAQFRPEVAPRRIPDPAEVLAERWAGSAPAAAASPSRRDLHDAQENGYSSGRGHARAQKSRSDSARVSMAPEVASSGHEWLDESTVVDPSSAMWAASDAQNSHLHYIEEDPSHTLHQRKRSHSRSSAALQPSSPQHRYSTEDKSAEHDRNKAEVLELQILQAKVDRLHKQMKEVRAAFRLILQIERSQCVKKVVRIQACWRGYSTRKRLSENGISLARTKSNPPDEPVNPWTIEAFWEECERFGRGRKPLPPRRN